jgi:hypothetical protein
MGCLSGKRVEFHPWGPRIKLHKWHVLWSTLEYWLNIPYLFRLPKLGGDTCQQLIGWKIMRLKIIEIKIHPIINKYIIINFKIMFPKFLGPICNDKKSSNND